MSRVNDPASDAGSSPDAMKAKVADVSQGLRDIGGQVRDAATDKLGTVKDQANQYYTQSREKAEEWEKNLETYVQEKPLQAVLMAAGIGMLLGLLWKRS